MDRYSENKKLNLFRNLFNGREDVFAIRWEKGKKRGYMPAYHYDPYIYRLHKIKGGSLKDFADKTYLPLTNHQLQKHFDGKQLIGIYPLLKDNNSSFIAADFDNEKWAEDCLALHDICKQQGIPSYLERSRSGQGGHVWIFFDKPYPAVKSRKILMNLLRQTGIYSLFDRGSSFDRLFPNQDFHSGKGLGNLIALPLHKPAMEKGNSCFVDEKMRPYQDQWKFLSTIKKVSVSHLDSIYDSLQSNIFPNPHASAPVAVGTSKLHIQLSSVVRLNRSALTPEMLGKYLSKQETDEFANSFGIIIVDECHHIAAVTFRNTISKLGSYFLYGLTATPFRKGNDGKIIFIHLGEIIADINPQEIEEYKRARVVVRETLFEIPFNPKTDPFETLSKILVHDSARNKLILSDIASELNKGKRAVIITERKDHIDTLYLFLKQSFEVVTLSGDDSDKSRKTKWKILNNGTYQVLITTGQFFGEGTDLQNATCLFLVYPFSFKGKLIQYIGRVQRSEITPIIYDYRDRKIEYLNRLFLKRNTYYRHFDRQATLFDDVEIAESQSKHTFIIEKMIKLPIEQLDFRYGAIAFTYNTSEINMELEFEVENDEVRSEFDVLKPYFFKVLKSKYVEVEIFAEFENSLLVSQKASSPDLENINREIIESVKFRFIEQSIIGKKYPKGTEENLLDIGKVQEGQNGKPFYDSEEQLLNDLLKNDKIKHYRQLRYLASKHDGTTLKLRFVLNPFSFVFLLPGTEQYHIVLETLDTEEATYIWHVDKNRHLLWQKLRSIDQDLSIIRIKGRQSFLDKHPENFSRIIHDYKEERKGYILWKDHLEERLL